MRSPGLTSAPGRSWVAALGLVVGVGLTLGPERAPAPPVAEARAAMGEAVFPGHRVVGFYGNPLSRRMGILGEVPPAEMLERLARQAEAYAAADPSLPVLPALHLVAVVANPTPGRNGLYRSRMPDSLVDRVAGWAESCGCLLFLDLQIGRSSVAAEVRAFLPWLRKPWVHLALDPEFAVSGDRIPGKVIGTLDAGAINAAVDLLAELVEEEGLPPKVLVVHRFTQGMVTNARRIRMDPAVQVVIDMDGFGAPHLKRDSYAAYVGGQVVQYTGFKLFYRQDRPLMSETDVLALRPVPLFILYQ